MIEFESEIKEITTKITDLLVKKRADYGSSFDDIWNDVGVISVVVRLMDKIARLKNLIINNKKPNNESIEDTFKDIIGYGVLSMRMIHHEV